MNAPYVLKTGRSLVCAEGRTDVPEHLAGTRTRPSSQLSDDVSRETSPPSTYIATSTEVVGPRRASGVRGRSDATGSHPDPGGRQRADGNGWPPRSHSPRVNAACEKGHRWSPVHSRPCAARVPPGRSRLCRPPCPTVRSRPRADRSRLRTATPVCDSSIPALLPAGPVPCECAPGRSPRHPDRAVLPKGAAGSG